MTITRSALPPHSDTLERSDIPARPGFSRLASIPGQVIRLRLVGALVALTRANVIRSPS
jgi:hypothetical protein